MRGDDSVVRAVGGRVRQMRRSRGWAPAPLALTPGLVPAGHPPILAAGAHLKNTLCLLRGDEAFLSQHVGDLDDQRTLEFFELTAGHLARILEARPEIIACDLHPDYLSTRWAEEQGLPLVQVQHHHAHAVAVMAEHGLAGPVLALALDGTGYGPDHTIWGGELLRADLADYERLGRVRPFRLPGGEAAVKQPWRIALGLLIQVYGERWAEHDLELIQGYAAHGPLIARMMERQVNSPLTSSLGRLFDAVSALAGVRTEVAYEGQAAVELEQILAPGPADPYPFDLTRQQGLTELDWEPMLREAVRSMAEGAPPDLVSARFHAGLVGALAQWAAAAARRTGLTEIVLGGGCFMNAHLLTHLPPLLEAQGLAVFTPSLVPAGDGAISFGQAVSAGRRWKKI